MNTIELRRKIESIKVCGSGLWRICICYHNKFYYCTTNNSLAIDRINDYDVVTDGTKRYGYTYKEAAKALYEECKRRNALGKYKYII